MGDRKAAVGFAMIAFLSPADGWFLATSTLAGFGFGMLMGAQLSVLMAQFADQAEYRLQTSRESKDPTIMFTICSPKIFDFYY